MTKRQKFEMYMSHLLAPLHSDHALSLATRERKERASPASTSGLNWLNVLIGRVFFDVLTEEVWGQLVAEKIQRKLNKIKVLLVRVLD